MTILGIDTSCDDTCLSLIKAKDKAPSFKILSNIVSSQVKLHAKYGGVWPFLAKREHQKNLPIVFKRALRQAQGKPIDLIAVTIGPGLEPCLWQGLNFAKDLAEKLKKPLIPISHLEAHILVNYLQKVKIPIPTICLVVSGGHTVLFLMKEIGKYKIIGETRDDAAGECFDKVARILGLGYPGGPRIAELARRWKSQIPMTNDQIKLPRPMIYQKNYDFSFSGLKTAVLYDFQSRPLKIKKSQNYIQEMCAETQQAIIDVLIHKTLKAAKDCKVKAIILGGGVAANDELRKQFKKACLTSGFKHLVPPKIFCTDNAVMVTVTAYFHQKKATINWQTPKENKLPTGQEIKANANLKI